MEKIEEKIEFTCNIDDLLNQVQKFTDTKYSNIVREVKKLDDNNVYVLLVIELTKQNLDLDNVFIYNRKSERYYNDKFESEFKNFCDRGIKQIGNTLSKNPKHIMVHTDSKYIQSGNSTFDYKPVVINGTDRPELITQETLDNYGININTIRNFNYNIVEVFINLKQLKMESITLGDFKKLITETIKEADNKEYFNKIDASNKEKEQHSNKLKSVVLEKANSLIPNMLQGIGESNFILDEKKCVVYGDYFYLHYVDVMQPQYNLNIVLKNQEVQVVAVSSNGGASVLVNNETVDGIYRVMRMLAPMIEIEDDLVQKYYQKVSNSNIKDLRDISVSFSK